MNRILTIIGARPQFVKAAVLSRAIEMNDKMKEVLVHTGQHFDKNMSDIFFEELQISQPKYFLNIHGGSHGQMTGKMIEAVEKVLFREKPDIVLVYGDTNSTLAGSIAAAKLNIPIAHVEAGLRSFNREMPEEINRVLTDHLSRLLLCPTKRSVRNLEKEGISDGVYHVGDIMHDATLYAKEVLERNPSRIRIRSNLVENKFALMTIHRQESTADDNRFSNLMNFADTYAKDNKLKILFPVHPRVKQLIDGHQNASNFIFMEPLSYLETQHAISKAQAVLTDSGGLQKEAYFHRVPCITLRSETEWLETIENGWNKLWTEKEYKKRNTIEDYGKGDCAKKIMEILARI